MPDIEVKSSWADEVEDDGNQKLPEPTETIKNGVKIITEYTFNENNQKVKIVRQYKMEKRIVSKTIAQRKTWPKFGDSHNDKPGPNPATTIVAEDVYMQFITNKEDSDKPDDSGINKLKGMDQNVMKCRNCKGDHWTTKCPYKDSLVLANKAAEEKKPPIGGMEKKETGGKYVPPSLREGAKNTDSMSHQRRDDTLAIRISNLSENTQEADLEDLVKPFGPYSKLYLAKDKNTNCCKGFAYVHFKFRADAAKAIEMLDGFGYDHLILNVDWSKPSQN
ncbi:eukaryotic translation initiation factor 3 subunit G [Cloeon dipterum]|uniref:eukaryotic translation initiation factor 3 subunit G n=1 Tax=Cloeon dipterum TaxID=197152 RepID=UPI0032200CA8